VIWQCEGGDNSQSRVELSSNPNCKMVLESVIVVGPIGSLYMVLLLDYLQMSRLHVESLAV